MASISIIGTGNMGQAIAAIAGKGDNNVEVFNTSDADRQVTGDIVVLAVPYPAVAGVLAERGAGLAGKVVVDITNPLNFETFDSLTVPADGSATAEIAAALPSRAWSRPSTPTSPAPSPRRRRRPDHHRPDCR